MPRKRRRRWTADIFCGVNQWYHGESRFDAPWVQEVNNEEIAVDAMPFQLRFLLQELIFRQRPFQPRPCLFGNLLCRVDWLCLRGIAQPERTILPILEVVTYSRCCSGGQSSSGERFSARRSLPAQT